MGTVVNTSRSTLLRFSSLGVHAAPYSAWRDEAQRNDRVSRCTLKWANQNCGQVD